MPVTDPSRFADLNRLQVPFGGGIHLTPSRVEAPLGTLTNNRNFEVVDGAYEESQGLTLVGPTLNDGLTDFWHANLDPANVVATGSVVTGDYLYWYSADGVTVAGTARIYYASLTASEVRITIDRVTGVSPRRATSLYTTNGATIEITATGDTFVYQSNLGLTWSEYLGSAFLGSLVQEQGEVDSAWDSFKPNPLGVQGISGVFQLGGDIYAVRDFWGGKFTAGEEAPSIGDEIEIDYAGASGTFTALVAGYKLTSGSWEEADAEGTLYLYPDASTSLDMGTVDNWDYGSTITNNTTTNTVGTALAQTGSVRQYENKGLLWKLAADSLQGGWQLVDTGYSLSFDSGEVAPVATVAPLITTDSIDTVVDTGFINCASPPIEYPSTGTYSAWSNLGNLDDTTPGVYASSTIALSDKSRVIDLSAGTTLGGDNRILGIEVQITCHQTAGTDVEIDKVQLRNDAAGTTQYLSANRGDSSALTTTPGTTYTFGGQLDTWELKDLNQEDLNNGDYHILVQFTNTSGVSSRLVNVDLIQFKVHYAATGQDVYFYDGTNDVVSGTLYAYQVFDGEWSTDDAEGWMTVYDIAAPSLVTPGMEIRSAPSGGGSLIAKARTISKNVLPSLEEMDEKGTIYQSVKASFSGDENSESVYVSTGAGAAFSVDAESRFNFIRLPVDRDKDIPKYVEVHRNHLILATGSHALVSSVGAPNNFNTYDGATTWGLKDVVTGLAAAADGTTMVACQDSIHLFTGSGATGQDAFAMKILTDNSGARDYTLTNLLGNVFVDYAGLTTADISDKYGGFDLGRKAGQIRPLFEELLGTETDDTTVGSRLIGGIPVRKKNQYRMYLSDGEILTATFPDDPQAPIDFTRQNYTAYYEGDVRGYEATFVPTALDSSVLANGSESIIMGTRLGHVMKIDPAYMDILSYANKNTTGGVLLDELQTWKPLKFIDLSPIHAEDASQVVHYKSAEVYITHAGYAEVARLAKTDYEVIPEVPVLGSPELSIGNKVTLGDYTDFPGTLESDYFSWYIDDMTDGLSVRFSKFGGTGTTPIRLTSMYMHVSIKGPMKNRIHSPHSPTLSPADLPQDVLIIGITGDATASGGTGTVTLDTLINGITGTATAKGNTGSVTVGANLWTWDDDSFTFDDDTDHTFDGST